MEIHLHLGMILYQVVVQMLQYLPTSKAISEGGKSDYAIITTDAHSLTEGQAIRISE